MHYLLRYTLILLTSLVLFSCSKNKGGKVETDFPAKPLIVPGDNGDDWGDGDFALSITNVSQNDNGETIKAVSTYKNEELGMVIFVPNSQGGTKGFGSGIVLKSIGKKSDRLLVLLASLYKQKIPANAKFVNSILVEYVDLSEFAKSLGGNASNKEPNTMEYKLFFKSKNDEAELYLNIKAKEQLVEIKEKDEEYRPTIIQMLEGH